VYHHAQAPQAREIPAEVVHNLVVRAGDLIGGQCHLMRPAAVNAVRGEFALAPRHAVSDAPKSSDISPKAFMITMASARRIAAAPLMLTA
jgi:hypothetical protein